MRVTCIAAFLAAVICASQVDAAVLIRVQELTDPGIVVRTSGSIDLSGLAAPDREALDEETGPLMVPDRGYIASGVVGLVDIYRGVFEDPATSFGPGGPADHWSIATGDPDTFFAIALAENALLLPAGYRSNSPIHAYTYFVGAPGFTLDSVGMTLGSYDFGLVNGDHVTVEVAPIPLPATLPMFGAGLLVLFGMARRFSGRSGRLHTT